MPTIPPPAPSDPLPEYLDFNKYGWVYMACGILFILIIICIIRKLCCSKKKEKSDESEIGMMPQMMPTQEQYLGRTTYSRYLNKMLYRGLRGTLDPLCIFNLFEKTVF